jgi:hypothetical protein
METAEVQLAPAADAPSPPLSGPVTSPLGHPTRRELRRQQLRDRRRARSRWQPVLVYVLGPLILVTATVAGIVDHARLQRTDTSLAAVRTELHRTLTTVSATKARLATVTGQAGAAGTALAAASNQLTTVQAELASAETGVRLDGVSISELDACLSGVDRALNEISLGDQSGAAGSLRQVASTCQAAEPSG